MPRVLSFQALSDSTREEAGYLLDNLVDDIAALAEDVAERTAIHRYMVDKLREPIEADDDEEAEANEEEDEVLA